ncbi:succinyl-CoA synthetase beta subunit/citryl-CoA synthetase large subunit [Caldalkalibacillus uzonensis]|uniref:Succinyl-CoA synthetase beta subunit/citryl-CoA synthetase large subunit n=1 Tax=Caldalkalibacillus uzonensis TaxID=353224 RepID=A0ABU0CWJ1_9BACI|nr:succinate--CoA ligase subunit beta [Caldalkalibacillus uzonensis]MDQ0340776.1 succinyl-CoA synthetase beta subunit/citryl-CoA synthetase large subunit [Caldalkalibacillus uzonensis]
MGRVLEHESKRLLGRRGVPTPEHRVANSPEEAMKAAEELGCPVVLKALVPVGKRGKAGAIKFADTPQEAYERSRSLLNMTVRHFPVEKVLVEEKVAIKQEWYVSITIDKKRQKPVIVATLDGGVDVEELVMAHPERIVTHHVDIFRGLRPFEAKEIWSRLGLTGKELLQAQQLLLQLYDVFITYDAYLLEINPLVLTEEGTVVAAASVMGVDDSALYRQPELAGKVEVGSERAWRPLTELEKKMIEINNADYRGTARYTEMEGGNIGFMCGGGGGSLLSFDALVDLGGQPANYTETGGNPPEEKVYGLTKGILSKPGVKGLFVAHNITNNTQVDVMARGIVRALKDMNIDLSKFPVVVREAGVNDEEGRRIFLEAGVEYYGEEITLMQAAEKMVQRMKEVQQ